MMTETSSAAVPQPTPCERLEASRGRIRQALAEASPAARAAGASAWREELRALPGAEILVAMFDQWWSQHPLRSAGLAASAVLHAAVGPLVRAHPLRSLLAALAVGGLLVWLKPWRWVIGTTLLAGLLQRLVAGAAQAPRATKP